MTLNIFEIHKPKATDVLCNYQPHLLIKQLDFLSETEENTCTSEKGAKKKKKSNSSFPQQSIKIDSPLTYNMQDTVVFRWKQPITWAGSTLFFLTFDEEAFAELEKY